MKTFLKSIVIAGLLFEVQIFAENYKLGGYYRSWAQAEYSVTDIPFDQLTHIFNAFAWPDKNGDLVYENGFVNRQLISLAHQKGVKVLVSVGGASNSYGFPEMCANDNKRARFVNNIIQFVQKYQYDGIDLDWEFPQTSADGLNLVKLVNELRKRLDTLGQGYLLTMAIPVGNWYGQWFQFDLLNNSVDWFNAMTYDFHGSWTNHSGHNAPLYSPGSSVDNCGSVDEGIKYLHYQRGIPSAKIVLGLAFYGKKFNTKGLYQSSTGGEQTYGYADIAKWINHGWNYHWDNVSKVPYLTNNGGDELITYDDTTSIALKCQYAKNNALAGCMIWALGHDKIDQHQPLLQTAATQLNINTNIDWSEDGKLPEDLTIQTFPNPFNNALTIRIFLKNDQYLRLKIVDGIGRECCLLADRYFKTGQHTLSWRPIKKSSGLYLVVTQTEKYQLTKKVLLLK